MLKKSWNHWRYCDRCEALTQHKERIDRRRKKGYFRYMTCVECCRKSSRKHDRDTPGRNKNPTEARKKAHNAARRKRFSIPENREHKNGYDRGWKRRRKAGVSTKVSELTDEERSSRWLTGE